MITWRLFLTEFKLQTHREKGLKSFINQGNFSKPQLTSRHESTNNNGADEALRKTITCELLRHKHSSHPTEGREYCKRLYRSVRESRFGGNVGQTDLFFFKTLGIRAFLSYVL